MRSLILAVLMLVQSLAARAPQFPTQHSAMHWIVTEDAKRTSGCTAYAIAPHALLTAEHCDLKAVDEDGKSDGSKVVLFVDPKSKPDYFTSSTPYEVKARLFDGHDHMILLVSGPEFSRTIEYNAAPPYQGEHVVTWGNPQGARDFYREGYVMGQLDKMPVPNRPGDLPLWMFDMPVQPGDSGSAVFDAEDGHLVTVITYGLGQVVMGAFTLEFTPAQIAEAKAYR